MPDSNPDFVHRYIPPSRADHPVTLLLLHGTGGDENDLVPLGEAIAAGAGMLSVRGKVLENGMPRFFRRLAEGVFDLDDLRFRTHELADYLPLAAKRYGFNPKGIIGVGFSNGANIAASLLLLKPGVLTGAALFSAMVPLVPDPLPALAGTSVFMASGRKDPVVSTQEAERLASLLKRCGAEVILQWGTGGHGIAAEAVEAARLWLTQVSLTPQA